MSQKLPSLAVKRRQKLARTPEAKGDPRKNNLWVVRLFDGTQTILSSDLSMEHLFYTEGDPSIRSARYPTEADIEPLGGKDIAFNAIVTRIDGNIECRHVRATALDPTVFRYAERLQSYHEAAKRFGGCYVEITAATLDQAKQRIQNWSRLLGAYRRCAQHPLGVLEQRLLERLTRAGNTTLGVALGWQLDPSNALVIAACAGLLRKREIASDLDEATWSLHTKIGGRQL